MILINWTYKKAISRDAEWIKLRQQVVQSPPQSSKLFVPIKLDPFI